MYIFLRYKKGIAEKISINKWSGLVRMKAALASLGLVILMVIGAGLTFSVQTASVIINIEDVPYNPGTRWIYSVGGKDTGAQSRRLTVQIEKSDTGRDGLLESVYFLEGSGIKRLYVRVLPNAFATYSSPEESTLIHKIQFPLKLGVEMEFQPSGLNSEIGPGPAKVRVTAEDKISVPFGTFNCLKLDVEPKGAKYIQEFSQWIAPNVGMVKQKITSAQGTQIFELLDFRRNAEAIWTSISPPMFQTDFHSSNLDEWIVASGPWTVTDGILSSGGKGKEYIWLKSYVWQDCKISYRFRLVSGSDAWVSFRANFIDEARGFSYFQIDDGSVKVRHTNPEGFETISNYAPAPASNQWHRMECVIKDARVDCFIDGKLTVSTQECPVNFGMMGFRTLDTKIAIDDIRVEKLASDVPKNVHTAESEPKKTTSLVITAAQIPMQVGNKWTFEIGSKDENLNGKEFTYSFYDKLEHQGKTFVRRRAEIPGIFERTEGLQLLRPDGWFGFWEPDDEVPYDIIKFPLSAGMEWEQDVLFKDKSGNKQLRWSKWEAEAEEKITVPAGTFRCVRVRYFNYTLDKKNDILVWFAPEIGLVKFIENGEHTFNLVKFER